MTLASDEEYPVVDFAVIYEVGHPLLAVEGGLAMSSRRVMFLAFAVSMMMATLFAASAQAGPDPDRPSRLVIIVLDQARPDTIDRYGMENVQALQRKGTSFPNAYVGHMAAETVISHNVITSGLFPKDMGWTNEVYRDVDNVLLGGGGSYHVTSSMSCSQFGALIAHGGYKKLQDYLDDRFGPDSVFASISQKRTSACTSGHTSATDSNDIIFQIRGSSASECGSGWRKPEFAPGAPPAYLGLTLVTGSCTNRWWTFQGAGAYGTGAMSPANIYPLEGNRFVPGFDPAHIGGDTWSADAAIRVIDNDPDWRGMMVSLGGIDKLGHMWGPEDEGEPGALPGSVEEMRRLPFVAKNADAQVGRIVDALETEGLLDDTLIVITADHAAQTGRPFHGVLAPGVTNPACGAGSTGIRSDCNWYFGNDSDEIYRDPSPAVAQLRDALAGNLDFSYQDGHVAAWLTDQSLAKKREAAEAVLDMPDVIASYHTNAAQNDYRLYGTNRMSDRERSWFARHGEELVDTMAAPNGADVVGLLGTDVTYGVIGDHGGHTRLIQEIPMVFYGPGVGSKDSNREIRLVDVMPTILDTMGIDYDPGSVDGEAVKLSKPKP
jgi:predicted AlkP superfamily pyrophosphatase or phosphodiesterase